MRRPSNYAIALLRRAGVTQPVIAEIGSRRRIVGPIPLRAVRHRIIIANRGARGDRAVVIIAVRVVGVVGAAVIAVARPDADASADRDARPEAAATVTITAAAIAATAASIIIPPTAAAYNGGSAGAGIAAESHRRGLPESGGSATHGSCPAPPASKPPAAPPAAPPEAPTTAADSCAATATGLGTEATLRLGGTDTRCDHRQRQR